MIKIICRNQNSADGPEDWRMSERHSAAMDQVRRVIGKPSALTPGMHIDFKQLDKLKPRCLDGKRVSLFHQ